MKITWLTGWSIPTDRQLIAAQEQFPDCEHTCIHPNKDAIDKVLASGYDHLIGYSLGTALILDSLKKFKDTKNITLITPILDFRKESDLGGRASAGQVQMLMGPLKFAPVMAINAFYKQAKIDLTIKELPYSKEDLIWGLNFLLNHSVQPTNREFNQVLLGEHDRLLDSQKLATLMPNSKIIPAAGHDTRGFLEHIKLNSLV